MKKLLFTIFLSVFCISIQAQLQRNILGAKLGVSTKTFVKSTMAKKGYKARVGDTNDTYFFDNVKFAGRKCDLVRFDFFSGKLASVTFVIATSFSRELPESEYDALKSLLDGKYANYKNEETSSCCSYIDSNTFINLQFLDVVGYSVGLSYMDRGLSNQSRQSVSDEL